MALERVLRVGIIGAGHISDFHMRALSRVAGARVVGIVDADRSRADALCVRRNAGRALTNSQDLFRTGVDVVHVLTPPESHASLTLEALSHGCHVYVEKPLATTAEDCDRIISAAREAGRSVCVGHSFLCDPTWRRARRLVGSGAIGEPLSVHYVRSTVYPKFRGGMVPEMYLAGGYPFRDMGVHGLYLIESLVGEVVSARPVLASTGRDPCLHCDEWTVALACQRGQATIHLSWNSRPQQHTLTVYGTRGVLRADLYAMYVSVKRARRVPEHVTRIVNSVVETSQMALGTALGLAGFALGRVRQYHGLQDLVGEFYESLREGRPSPVTPEQARSVVAWTESIAAEGDRAKSRYLAAECRNPTAPTLVTGGTGLIGRRLVQRLLDEGRRIRLLVRRLPADSTLLNRPDIELIIGDLGDQEAVNRAVAGTSAIFHLGAALRGTTEEFDRGTIAGTRHIVEAGQRHKIGKLVYVSSLSVLHALAGDQSAVITEDWPLEPNAHLRGNYSRTKLEAERLVREAAGKGGLPAIVLRPGEVLGDGPPRLTAGVALQLGARLIVLGNGKSLVPMVYVEDLVDALLQAERSSICDGSVFHLVDPAQVSQNELVERCQASAPRPLRVMHLPQWIVRLAGLAGDALGALTNRRLPITSYRLQSACAARRFNCDLAARALNWQPRAGVQTIMHGATPLATPANAAGVQSLVLTSADYLPDRDAQPAS